MNSGENKVQRTQHAFLVAWGWYAEHISLPERFKRILLKQKRYQHTPQTKVLEFLVSILSGAQYLQDISQAAHPLDKDHAVAEAWGQPDWADYSGVSRTLSGLSWEEARQVAKLLEEISQGYVNAELQELQSTGQRIQYDGDLTGLPVSNTSQSYPNAAFGHMDDTICLGYQAALLSLRSPRYGRLWLSGTHHPGDTVACTQTEPLLLAAEARTGVRPLRRTDLLSQRIATFEQILDETKKRRETQIQALQQAQEALADAQQQQQDRQTELEQQAKEYQERQRKERPTSRLAQVRHRAQAATQRLQRRQNDWKAAQKRLDQTTALYQQQMEQLKGLYQRLKRFEQDNAANRHPVKADFRLDAGFGTYENVVLLIEYGYEVYTKPHNQHVVAFLKKLTGEQTTWTRVGANAELIAWHNLQLSKCPYALDVALERFYTGKTLKHSALLHFGTDPVTEDLPGWFQRYNGRQTIEAGIKETKQVFFLHHIKVRSEPAIFLQECLVLFAANFIRWATHWLAQQALPDKHAIDIRTLGTKRQVKVAAHVSAQVIQNSESKLLKFSQYSAFAGKILKIAPDLPADRSFVKT